jgi:hypothetical protein
MAVENHASNVTTAAPDEHRINNAHIAQMAIVIDDDDYEDTCSGRYNSPIQLYHVQIVE